MFSPKGPCQQRLPAAGQDYTALNISRNLFFINCSGWKDGRCNKEKKGNDSRVIDNDRAFLTAIFSFTNDGWPGPQRPSSSKSTISVKEKKTGGRRHYGRYQSGNLKINFIFHFESIDGLFNGHVSPQAVLKRPKHLWPLKPSIVDSKLNDNKINDFLIHFLFTFFIFS